MDLPDLAVYVSALGDPALDRRSGLPRAQGPAAAYGCAAAALLKLAIGNEFQLGTTGPEIDITPGAAAALRVNTTSGSNLFDDDPFRAAASVPPKTGYLGVSITGSVALEGSVPGGDLTFGVAKSNSITFEYIKAFPIGAAAPTLGHATGQTLSHFVIPADVADLKRMSAGDVSAVSGDGSLRLSASLKVATPVNPLASVSLPLNVGAIKVQHGAMAGVSCEFTLSGSYEIRVRSLPGGAVELSYLRKSQSALKTVLSASAGVAVNFGDSDVLTKLLGAIGTDSIDEKVLAGLKPDEVNTFAAAVKDGIAHSVQASLDAALTASNMHEAAFQYEIEPDQLDVEGRTAVRDALGGDLRKFNEMEARMGEGGTLATGIRLRNSIFKEIREQGVSLHVNLLGIVNLVSVSNLIDRCEFIADPPGHLTIKETAQSDRITAIVKPYDRAEALRKAMFDSVVVTTAYRASEAVALGDLECHQVHFAENQNTSRHTLEDYLGWFLSLNLLRTDEFPAIMAQFGSGGLSSCLLRTSMDNAACTDLFLRGGSPRVRDEYLDIGRQALRALLDPNDSDIDRYRYAVLTDPLWTDAKRIGASPELGTILPMNSQHPQYQLVLNDVVGDVYDINWWADAMSVAAAELNGMRTFLGGRAAQSLADDKEFEHRRVRLQQAMLKAVKTSKARFHEPWGMVCLYWAAGSRVSAGSLNAGALHLERHRP